MSNASVMEILKKKMRQAKDELETARDQAEEAQQKLELEIRNREAVSTLTRDVRKIS